MSLKIYRLLIFSSIGAFLIYWLLSFSKGLPSIYPSYFDDEGILATLGFFAEWGNPEMASKYPVLSYLLYAPIILVVFGLGAVFSGNLSLSPHYPFGFSNPEMVFSIAIYGMRLLNLIFLGFAIRYAYQCLKKYKISIAYPELLLGGLLTPIVLYYGYTTNRDFLVYLLSTLISFELWLIIQGKKSLLLLMLFAIAGVLTKDFMAFYGLLAVLISFGVVFKRLSLLKMTKEVGIASGILIGLLLIYHPQRLWVHIHHWLLNGDGVEPYRQFPTDTIGEKLQFLSEISPVFLKMWPLLFPILVLIFLLKQPDWKVLLVFLLLIPLVHILGIIVPIGFSYPRFYLPVYASFLIALVHLLSKANSIKIPWPSLLLKVHLLFVLMVGMTYMVWDFTQFPKSKLFKLTESQRSNQQLVVFKGGVQNLPSAKLYTYSNFFLERTTAAKIKHHSLPLVELDTLSKSRPYLLLQDQPDAEKSHQLIKSLEFQEINFPLSSISFMAHHSYYNYYFYQIP